VIHYQCRIPKPFGEWGNFGDTPNPALEGPSPGPPIPIDSCVNEYDAEEGECMRVGFVVKRRAKELEVHMSVPDNNERSALVTCSHVGDSFALLMGHLFHRSDRLAQLQAVCSPECQTNDAALALAVYHHRGMAALAGLEGDFALLIWDAETAQLLAMRDPLGGYPLFWIQHEGTIAFSTSTRPLCAMLPQCTLNEAYCAQFLMVPGPLHEMSSEQCVYLGLQRVLPGTMVIAKTDSDRIERRPYWDWPKHIKDPGTSDLGEVAEQYYTLLRTAVQERMHGCTLAHLSGGMDSTSVALLARDLVRSGRGEAPLHTVSQVYNRLAILARERPYIESALHDETALVAHRLLSDDLLDFDSFTDPPLHDEPHTALAYMTSGQHIVNLAASIGALTILTGHGSDEMHSFPPYSLYDLLREHRYGEAWQQATTRAQAGNHSPWRTLITYGLKPLVAQWAAGKRWASLGKIDTDWDVPCWVRPDFARRHALQSRAIEEAQQSYQQCEQTSVSYVINALKRRAGDVWRWELAAPLGIAHTHPFLDTRLLSFSLGMQSRIERLPGQVKPVLAEAMRDILPDIIRYRQSKRGFNEVYHLGLGRNLHSLEALIQQTPLESMIDKELLIEYLLDVSLAGVPVGKMHRINYILALLKWLSLQEKWLHVQEKVTTSFRIEDSRSLQG